jgi:putative FmdB family regulatory protein
MPIYEFSCCKCGRDFEKLVFGSEKSRATCPDCGSEDTRKRYSVFSCSPIERSLAKSCGTGPKGSS